MKIYRMILLCIMLISVWQTGFPAWRFAPKEPIGVKKGDIILSAKPDSAVGQMLKVLGHYWDHCVVALDDKGTSGEMINNTFDEALLNKIIQYEKKTLYVKNPLCGDFCPPIAVPGVDVPRRLEPLKLSNADPGIVIEPMKGTNDFKARLTTQSEDNRTHLHDVADEMRKMDGYYILNAFVDLKQYEPVYLGERDLNKGSQCSGTIWWASKYAGKEMSLFTLDNRDGVISACANTMFGAVKQTVQDYLELYVNKSIKCKWFSDKRVCNRARKEIYKQLTSGDINADDKIAHQVVNTFLFNRSSRTDGYWIDNINSVKIESIAPDHLLMMGMPDKNGNFDMGGGMPGRQQSFTSYYDAITDYSETGGYYYNLENGLEEAPVDPRYTTIFNTPCEMGLGVECCM